MARFSNYNDHRYTEVRRNSFGTVQWLKGNGRYIRITKMCPSHVLNVMNMLEMMLFSYEVGKFTDCLLTRQKHLTERWPIFSHLLNEAAMRDNPWPEDHPECVTLLDAYNKLKRGLDVVKDDEPYTVEV